MQASAKKQKKAEKLSLGERLRRVVIPKSGTDKSITLAMVCLMIFGSAMVISTNLGTTVGHVRDMYIGIIRQGMFCVLGWFVYCFLSWVFNYRRVNRILQWILVGAYFVVLVYTAIAGIDVNGSKAWISLGLATVQPSEFGKPLLILMLALSIHNMKELPKEKQTFWHVFTIPLVLLLFSVVFVGGLQKDFGSLIITLGIGFVGIMVPSYKNLKGWQHWLLLFFLVMVILFVVGVYVTDWFTEWFSDVPLLRHIAVRIANMKNPYLSIHDEGYQPANALYGIADGGLFGQGFGSSVRKYGFLTQAESDYILAIVIEETGIIGLGVIVALYGLLVWRLLYWALHVKEGADKVLFTCTAAYFMLHFIINVGGVSTLLPMTGVPLLLISAGGSSLMAVCIALGIAQARIVAIRPRIEMLQDIEHKSKAAMDEYHNLQNGRRQKKTTRKPRRKRA
ncbi:FtsW/RodA/SpoVE family cell cycle protein [Erysipelotrichaceae bacterium 51-3]